MEAVIAVIAWTADRLDPGAFYHNITRAVADA
jgi:hypothetical protein